MNEVLKVIKNRYTCRSFSDDMIEKEKLEALALAALQAPSGMNRQPWKIIVIKDKSIIDHMDACGMNVLKNKEDQSSYLRMMERGGKLFYNAQAMIVIAIEEGKTLDCGIVVENIALAASSLGLGNCICGMAALPISLDEFNKMIIPTGYVFGTSILLGYPTENNGTPHEVDMTKITYIG